MSPDRKRGKECAAKIPSGSLIAANYSIDEWGTPRRGRAVRGSGVNADCYTAVEISARRPSITEDAHKSSAPNSTGLAAELRLVASRCVALHEQPRLK